MNVRATAKFVGTSSRKIGLVAALIRGRQASEAVTVLEHTAKRATDPVGKVLKSAIANAENNYKLNVRDLQVESVLVGPGPTLKRFRPRAKGQASSIRKRTSHITVVLSQTPKPKAKPVAAQPAGNTEQNSIQKKEAK
jgi:large subunit ribosomal protein L22